jgi:murein DD-endopeptidase MepM/ murein hydrolase activator NlpD
MRRQPTIAALSAALLFATGVAAALADPTTTTVTTTTVTTTTVATTAPSGTTTAPVTTTAPTTTAPTTTAPATTAPLPSTSTTTPVPETPPRAFSFARGCPIAGVVLLLPNGSAKALGGPADVEDIVYPDGGSILTASPALGDAGCTRARSVRARAELRSVSLFAGEITAARISVQPEDAVPASVSGLVVYGRHVFVGSPETRIPLQTWGYLVAGSREAVAAGTGGRAVAALAIHLLRPHGGLPAGTSMLLAVAPAPPRAAAPARARRSSAHTPARARRRRRAARHEPLTVRPPLGQRHYIFPVVGASDYIDTYGAFRGDVPGNWHHGDDIFAALGTPVVAVAGGTINRVGWEKLGGWRLWVRDDAGDEFYYAHLSGYAPTDLHSNRVEAGEVIGFVGNSGDAFTTAPHLHFEIHPRPLLHLGYDGAVDPTTYLDGWTHLHHADAPRPAHPPLPEEPRLRSEARYIFRELLAARHVAGHVSRPSPRPHVPIPAGANGLPIRDAAPPVRVAAAATAQPRRSSLRLALLVGMTSLALFATTVLWIRRRFRPPTGGSADVK